MPSWREWLVRIGGSLHGRRSDRDFEDELLFHVEAATEDARRRDDGAAAADRVRQVRLSLGGVAQSVELMRQQQQWPWLEDAKRDLQQTFRMLKKSRGFATVTVLTLGLGIAASTVMFTVLNAVVLQPLPYRDPARLLLLWIDGVKRQLHATLVPYPLYAEWKERSPAVHRSRLQHAEYASHLERRRRSRAARRCPGNGCHFCRPGGSASRGPVVLCTGRAQRKHRGPDRFGAGGTPIWKYNRSHRASAVH